MRILYIDIDSLRPDHLGCYGYHRDTSPNIDSIARESMIFTGCYTPDAPCMPSRTAFYSGRFGIQTGVVGHGGTGADPKPQGVSRSFDDQFGAYGLGRQLQNLGFHTAMISPFGQRHSAHWFYAGFNEIHNTGLGGMESAEQVLPVIKEWLLKNQEQDNWFLHINLWDPHTPYRVPEHFGNPFEKTPLPDWLQDPSALERHQKMVGPHSALDVGMYNGEEDPNHPRQPGSLTCESQLRRLIDGYDTGVLYADDAVGQIIQNLKDAGLYEETAIIVSSDHGENLGELGIYAEHGTADEITCKVPMIIKWPGGHTGINSKLHYNLDLAPTLMDLLGGETQEIWDGQSFAAAIVSGDSNSGREEVALSQCAHVAQRSIRWADWLYLRTYHDGFHLFPQEMLFNLKEDPYEQNDLAATSPEICKEGAWRLMRWHDAQMQKMAEFASDSVDPLWTVVREGGPFHARPISPGHPGSKEALRAYFDRLENTGRSEGAAKLRERHAARISE
ncbi:sulfatase-like hydrolase/transferase [Pelagicoccus albus]|uniref:Sulfatase-like hydrolase/transferase n=1 Tax=Pelagicoccus albus TaxID=415222 RepID=A0A7X1B7Z4_9BACT|nr:sulfatase-like hydrolase/transferase [Pelagicoccus albus]MBC2607074.1 sulfatase-like hydrolase/transferase [Pelagicoccus albus]